MWSSSVDNTAAAPTNSRLCGAVPPSTALAGSALLPSTVIGAPTGGAGDDVTASPASSAKGSSSRVKLLSCEVAACGG